MPPAKEEALLERVAKNIECIHSLQPSDIDKLGVESSLALQRASVPESTVSLPERLVNEIMLRCIGQIDHIISLKADSARDIAMLMLYRRTLITSDNLEALLRMCDSNIRTGKVRCNAIWQLRRLVSVQATWKVKLQLQPNSNISTSTSFAAKMITVMSAALSEHRSDLCGYRNNPGCGCHVSPWVFCVEALGVYRDEPEKAVDLLHPWDWVTILQPKPPGATAVTETSDVPLFLFIFLFIALCRWPIGVLKENRNNIKAKEVLQKLGSCDTLLRRVLRGVIAGEMSCTPGANMSFEELERVDDFLGAFLHCLSPLPWDREIDSLVRRTRSIIAESLTTIMINETAVMVKDPERSTEVVKSVNELLFLMDKWKELHQESEEACWQRFHSRYLVHNANPHSNKELSKSILKLNKKMGKASANLTEGEMCANCYVLENTLDERLLKCGQCRLIKYCSRECQREHWKKAHKKQCKKLAPV
jgi:hypothetical protein